MDPVVTNSIIPNQTINEGMSIHYPLLEYRSEKAEEFSFLHEIIMDLSRMQICMNTIILFSKTDDSNPLKNHIVKIDNKEEPLSSQVTHHLFNSLLIDYARCFTTGTRIALDAKEVYKDYPEMLKAHTYYMEYRNRHIAHPVNRFQQANCAVILSSEDPQNAEILGLGRVGRYRLSTPDDNDIEWVLNLINASHIHTKRRIDSLHEELLQEVKGKPIEEIRKLPPFTFTPEGSENIKRGKSHFNQEHPKKIKNKTTKNS